MKMRLSLFVLCAALLIACPERAFANDAKVCEEVKDYRETVRACTRLLSKARFKNMGLVYFKRALAHYYLDAFDEALEDYDRAIRLNPKLSDVYTNRSAIYNTRRDPDRSIIECSKAIEMSPNDVNAYNNCANAYREKGQIDRALEFYNQAIYRGGINKGFIYANRSEIYRIKGDYDRALADCNDALRLEPTLPQAYENCGNVYRDKGDLDRAFAEYYQAERLFPKKDAEFYLDRGEAFFRKGDYERAIADYDEALRIDPKVPEAAAKRELALVQRSARPPVTTGQTAVAAAAAPKDETSAMPPADAHKLLLVPPAGKRAALVIGNSAYRTVSPLPNPRRDAEAVALALTRLGFEVSAEYDLTESAMRRTLAAFETKAAGADWGLVYYAGHGMEMDGRNWLIPVDARLDRLSDVPDETVSLDRVLDRVRTARKLRMVVLDACRNNPFLSRMVVTGGGRAVGRGLAKVEPEHGEVVFYAARDGSIAADGTGRHSPFSGAFLQHLNEEGLELGRFFRRVTSSVLASTSPQQEPFMYGRLPDEDFYFIPPK